MSVYTPYNFVPIEDKVVFPYWAPFISHDVPFKNGKSGKLTIEIEAKSPIFVRNGTHKSKKEKEDGFSYREGKGYFIPATSLKGMIRNILEIITFSKMAPQTDDDRYAIRDLSSSGKSIYRDKFNTKTTFCGWLRQDLSTRKYLLVDCGTPWRISHQQIDEYFFTGSNGSAFSKYFREGGKYEPNNARHKTARHKYELLEQYSDRYLLTRGRNMIVTLVREDKGRSLCNISKQQTKETKNGHLVLTGQPGIVPSGKNRYEFIFLKNDNQAVLEVSDRVIQDFFFAYNREQDGKVSEDWVYNKNQLEIGHEIPVFFLKEGDAVSSIGLSYLFKLPYKKSVHQAMPNEHLKDTPDFAQAIFGFIQGEGAHQSLKGRVYFSHTECPDPTTLKPLAQVRTVLASPKASYYPTYIRQPTDENGKLKRKTLTTFMDDGARIAGWKYYPPLSGDTTLKNPPPNDNRDILSVFTPLDKGAKFIFTITFHNLRPEELGALISAVTLHQTPLLFHRLGLAKPLGYGKIALKATSMSLWENAHTQEFKDSDLSNVMNDYLAAFEHYMDFELGRSWRESDAIKELLCLVSVQPKHQPDRPYMTLDPNEFVKAKNDSDFLKPPSLLPGVRRSALSPRPILPSTLATNHQQEKTLFAGAMLNADPKDELKARLYKALEDQKAALLEELRNSSTGQNS